MSLKYSFLVKIIFIIFLFSYTSIKQATSQSITDANMKSILIYKFAKFTEWENEESLDTFRIDVYGDEPELLKELKILESVNLKNKPIRIVPIRIVGLFFSFLNTINNISAVCVNKRGNILSYFSITIGYFYSII